MDRDGRIRSIFIHDRVHELFVLDDLVLVLVHSLKGLPMLREILPPAAQVHSLKDM